MRFRNFPVFSGDNSDYVLLKEGTVEKRIKMEKKKKKQEDNYLDYIPVKNPDFGWRVKENGRVEVTVQNKGVFNRIAQIFFRRPKVSYIELDEYGSYLWQQIDGKSDIHNLSIRMKEHFGKKAEPVVERLVQFMRTLQVNHYISYATEDQKKK